MRGQVYLICEVVIARGGQMLRLRTQCFNG
jgi:hypothetical protein